MSEIIAFVSQLGAAEEKQWIEKLATRLPGETLVRISDMTLVQKQNTKIAIVANPDPADILDLPNLIWIHSVWAGVERLVSELEEGTFEIVRLVDPELARTMAEAVLSWSLYLHRDMPAYAAQQRSHVWNERPYIKASDRTVGILGLGTLGIASAHLLAQFGFSVMGWSRSSKVIEGIATRSGPDGLADIVSKSDILVSLLPLTVQTQGLIDKKIFDQLPDQAGFINFGRGAVVSTDDLVDALDKGSLSHAVLDVFKVEPLPIDSLLWDHQDITILPHISAPTDMDTASDIVSQNIRTYRDSGALPQTIDRQRGY